MIIYFTLAKQVRVDGFILHRCTPLIFGFDFLVLNTHQQRRSSPKESGEI